MAPQSESILKPIPAVVNKSENHMYILNGGYQKFQHQRIARGAACTTAKDKCIKSALEVYAFHDDASTGNVAEKSGKLPNIRSVHNEPCNAAGNVPLRLYDGIKR